MSETNIHIKLTLDKVKYIELNKNMNGAKFGTAVLSIAIVFYSTVEENR